MAEEKIETDNIVELVKKLPSQTQIVLYSAILLQQAKDSPIYTGELYDIYKGICIKSKFKPLTQRRVSDLLSELDMLGILSSRVISMGRYGRTKELNLSIPESTLIKVRGIIESEIGLK